MKPAILIVDDSDITRASLTKIFNEYICAIYSCHDGMAGIQKALVTKPDLIILDILMPNLDGIKMLQIIKLIEELKEIPVIVLSGNVNKSNLLAAMEAGADKVINKPFVVSDLISAVNDLLKNPLERNILPVISSTQKSASGDEELKNIFVEKFPTQKKNIIRYVTTRDKNRLKNIFHQLKGVGTTVGFPQDSSVYGTGEFSYGRSSGLE
jgi:CheY-like chemotaxis protein